MLDINPVKETVTPELIERYRNVDTSSIGHLTTEGYIRGIKAQTGHCRLLGRVITVTLHEMDGSPLYQALTHSCPEDVLVISMPGYEEYACWGELRTIAAMIKGLGGIITDGCITDLEELGKLPFPVFAQGTSAITTRELELGGQINAPLMLKDQPVAPGYLAIGDADGFFILSPEQAEKLIDPVLEKQEYDRKKRCELLKKLDAVQK